MQRYFTRRLFPLSTLSYRERLSVLDLESLELRRLKCDLKVYFQIINGLTVLDIAQFFCFPTEPVPYQRAQPEIRKASICQQIVKQYVC